MPLKIKLVDNSDYQTPSFFNPTEIDTFAKVESFALAERLLPRDKHDDLKEKM